MHRTLQVSGIMAIYRVTLLVGYSTAEDNTAAQPVPPRTCARPSNWGARPSQPGLTDDEFTFTYGETQRLDVLHNDFLERPAGALISDAVCVEPGASRVEQGHTGLTGARFTDVTIEAGLSHIKNDEIRTAPNCLFDESAAQMDDARGRALYKAAATLITTEGYLEKIHPPDLHKFDHRTEDNMMVCISPQFSSCPAAFPYFPGSLHGG